jgi:hypothetical protein
VSTTTEAEKLTRVAACARAFLRAYDEFGDDYPPAVGEWLEPLIEAIDALGDEPAPKVEVYSRPECIFHYCPDEEGCRGADNCLHPRSEYGHR